jgi:medium-chain acyl-[acyl-carrier-protein] hydrolase
MRNTSGSWFHSSPLQQHRDIKLFCFPYAGGSASIYREWVRQSPSAVQLIAVELPGRGARLTEPPFVSLPPLLEVLAEAIFPLLDKKFAFFGHSMGALIAFELARLLRRRYGREPQLLIASGRRAPQVPNTEPLTYNLPRDEFIANLQRIDGTPKEVLEHTELMELMMPLLRADFQLNETYEYVTDAPLQCPIIAFGGLQDTHVAQDTLLSWKEQTTSDFNLHMLPGDHFFLRSSQYLLLQTLALKLQREFRF